ncbi:hypothetical protein [Deinococcus navajonensis]|uniref:HNH endonuclease n=1 Tax=Deinococcus navajonensis TaxID=309884 RepID=A0ABV8XNS7_9DEIO
MPNVIIQPAAGVAARAHYTDTIQSPVPVDTLVRHLTGHILPRELDGLTEVPVWGVTPGARGQNTRLWAQIQRGDAALFYGQKRFFASSTVLAKLHAPEVARALWGEDPVGQTWEYLYFLDEITERDLPVETFNRVMNYNDRNIPQGFQVIGGIQAEALLTEFDLESGTVVPEVTLADYYTVTSLPAGDLDRRALVNQRREQRFLRRHLFQNQRAARCCLCGRWLPVELLVAAHIKRRADCTLEEKRDFQHLVAPMCQLGCDGLYERQYVVVDGHGIIRRNPGLSMTDDLKALVTHLEGRPCTAWHSGTQAYFAWHARHQRRRVS